MSATKEQERKALEQIKKIVEGLGNNSYIGMAFEGCFEIAEENIANDSGCSMKQRAEKAQKDADYFQKAANYESDELEKAQTENERLRNELAKAKKRELNRELYASIYSIIKNAKKKTDEGIMNDAKMAATFKRGSETSNNALDRLEELFREKSELEKIVAGLEQIDYSA